MFNPDDDFDDFGQESDKQPLASNAETIEPANAKPHQTASDARRPTRRDACPRPRCEAGRRADD